MQLPLWSGLAQLRGDLNVLPRSEAPVRLTPWQPAAELHDEIRQHAWTSYSGDIATHCRVRDVADQIHALDISKGATSLIGDLWPAST